MFTRFSFALVFTACALASAHAQTAAPKPTPRPSAPAQNPQPAFDLAEYGVRLEPDQRLIVVMAALEAAGFDPTAAGKEPSTFRAARAKG